MIYLVLVLWIITAIFILVEKKMIRLILWLGISSMIAAWAFLLLGSPDVAMAEASISAFTTVFFIVCFERYFDLRKTPDYAIAKAKEREESLFRRLIFPLVFSVFLCGLFVYHLPNDYFNTYLKELYLERFTTDVGGLNAVTSIYLGYRVYDTLFEALMLVVAVVAVIHVSHFSETSVTEGKRSEMEHSKMATFLLRLAAPLIILFGIYLIVHGAITAGGGFQGGLALAGFFICRYMIYGIYDAPIERIGKMEELVFIAITILAILIVFQGAIQYLTTGIFQDIYLLAMNTLVGLKVACSFIILFYRYVAIERK